MTVQVLLIVASSYMSMERVRADEDDIAPISFARDIRPILSTHCFQCHGPDETTREAELRLDLESEAHSYAIVPGAADESELIRRIESGDPDERMPPVEANRPLSHSQIELLRRWVREGAAYEVHWAFQTPACPDVPTVNDSAWPRNAIDHFTLRKLSAAGLQPSPEADRFRLVRRVYLDLIGLPPTPAEADAFVHDSRSDAYEELVDRLLNSPHYGERWARRWLDLARYSDTNGYEKDHPREMWMYRDWVIDAINRDMPFDQFTIEQIAGDMLPEASIQQRIATGFHRNTMINEEGGIDPQEFRYHAIVDRVATTGTTWLGLTVGCAQCHTHKFDPISHTDFYRLFALMNNADEIELRIPTPDVKDQRNAIQAKVDALIDDLPNRWPLVKRDQQPDDDHAIRNSSRAAGDTSDNIARREAVEQAFKSWQLAQAERIVDWTPLRPLTVMANLPTTEVLADGSVLASGDVTKNDTFELTFAVGDEPITAVRIEALPDARLPGGGPGRQTIAEANQSGKGNFFLSEVEAWIVDGSNSSPPIGSRAVLWKSATASYISPGLHAGFTIDGRGDTGWSVHSREEERHTLVLVFRKAQRLAENKLLKLRLQHESFYPAGLGRFRISVTSDAGRVETTGYTDELARVLKTDVARRTAAQAEALWQHFLLTAPLLAEEHEKIRQLRESMPPWPTALVLDERERDPRVTHRYHRGEYLKPKEVVQPGPVDVLHDFPSEATANRLALARWLVDPHNPLTARVMVNRAWAAFFGRGLVATSDNFGYQGSYPTHPELLDWLATEFVENGWSRKNLHRLIVTSATYRQSSDVCPELLASDPENKLLARNSRFRVDAETVRDIVLKASGLLSDKMGGPSVFPTQPAGITEAAYGSLNWIVSDEDDRYRRGLYTFNKRTAPYAAFSLFDAPSGEACVARRTRSNTPLQSLAMLNDRVTSEAARRMAATSCRQCDSSCADTAEDLFRRCVTRPPSDAERDAIVDFFHLQKTRFQSGAASANRVLMTGPKLAWQFEENDLSWQARNQCKLSQEDGQLVIECLGEDPFLSTAVLTPAGPHTVHIRGMFPDKGAAQIFWTTRSQPEESVDRVATIEVEPQTWKTYQLIFDATDELTSVRFDPGGSIGVVRIDSIELIYGDGLFELPAAVDPRALAAWHLVARALLNLDETITRP